MIEWIDADWLLSPDLDPMPGGSIGIDKDSGQIVEVRPSEAPPSTDGVTFLTPGLINAHTHLELYRHEPIPVENGETFADWILKVVAITREMSGEDRQQACEKSILEMIRTGTTCVNDITALGHSLSALSKIGMRGIVSPEFFFPFHAPQPDMTHIIEQFQFLKDRFKDHPLLQVGIAPHSPYNVTPNALAAVLETIDPAIVHIHVAETEAEAQWFETGGSSLDKIHEQLLGHRFGPTHQGTSPITPLKALLSDKWVSVHGTYLSTAEADELIQHNASLIHCPRSNLWLTGKTLSDLHKLQDQGLVIGLGTDSRFSNPNLDLRSEGRQVMATHGLSARCAFELMTAGSARALKMGHQIGFLKPGFAADLVLWHYPHSCQTDAPYDVWFSEDTEAKWVQINGRTVLEKDF